MNTDPVARDHPPTSGVTASPVTHDASAMPRVALVTGAARRLGRHIAVGLARAGWDIVVHCRESVDEARHTVDDVRAAGRRAVVVRADLADESQVLALFDEALRTLGPIGCVVNNASRFEHDTPASAGYASLDAHLRTNLAAPLALARRLHESLPDGCCGVVINILDQKLENLNPDYFSYTLSKAALLAATRMMAMSFAPSVRVVAVSPGITLASGDQSPGQFEAAHRVTPLGRSSRPQDIVDAVVFAAQAGAITGVNLPVDGGQHLWPLPHDVMYLTPGGPVPPDHPVEPPP